MNKKMYKQILVAMMFSSVSTAVFAAEQDVRPVSLESMNTAVASAPLAADRMYRRHCVKHCRRKFKATY